MDPYQTPSAQDEDDERNIKGGFLKSEDSKAAECLGAWLSLKKRYLRVKYLPVSSNSLVLVLFGIGEILLIPFPVVNGVGGIFLYGLSHTIVRLKDASKVELLLDEEHLLIDSSRRIIGVRKIQKGKALFIGAKVRAIILDSIKNEFPYTEVKLKPGGRSIMQLFALSMWAVSMALGLVISN